MQFVSDSDAQINGTAFQEIDTGYVDFKDILGEFGLIYSLSDFYLQVGEISQVQGWILHLSVVKIQISSLLRLIIPELVIRDIPFKIIRDSETARNILDAELGYYRLGKIVAIYPREQTDIVELAMALITLTIEFRGPSVPTDRHLGGILYTRYGSYKPIVKPDSPDKARYIFNSRMELVPDEFIIPYKPPSDVKWPFDEIVPAVSTAAAKLLKNTYKTLIVVKDDTKGRVLKGIYLKGLFNFKYCIIKEGKRDMWLDEQGRDIQDRLKWQYELCNDLSGEIPFPRIFDLFEDHGDLYLAMEFINGRSLEETVYTLYEGRTWIMLSVEERKKLLEYLVEILLIIEKFHQKGYLHRDITPANFLIDKKNKIFLIDMELSYSVLNKFPYPPFKVGTMGYASPEQKAFYKPEAAQDIYSIGALMLFIFTGFSPTKFNVKEAIQLKESIFFFTKDTLLSNLIANCLDANPGQRPALSHIIESVTGYQKEGREGHFRIVAEQPVVGRLNDERVLHIINSAIRGLKTADFLTEDLLWDSPVLLSENGRNGYMERRYLPDFYNGMSGILYCLAKAKENGYNIDELVPAYHNSFIFIKENIGEKRFRLQHGLYHGKAGVAVAIVRGLEAKLISPDAEYRKVIEDCFDGNATTLDVANGIAGQGVALLYCAKWLDSGFVEAVSGSYLKVIIERQMKDGSWDINTTREKKHRKEISFAGGIPGIVSFLLEYVRFYPDEAVTVVIRRALNLLRSKGKENRTAIYWKTSDPSMAHLISHDNGLPGITSVFMRAYKYLEDPAYGDVAKKILNSLPAFPLDANLTMSDGLAGIGELYLEAFHTFHDEEWRTRANWVAQVLDKFLLTDRSGNSRWTVDYSPGSEADLMTGNSGILHFFMDYRSSQEPDFLRNRSKG